MREPTALGLVGSEADTTNRSRSSATALIFSPFGTCYRPDIHLLFRHGWVAPAER